MKSGVNKNGVQWVKDGNTFYCSYYYGDGVTINKTIKDVKQRYIDKLTFEQLKALP